MTAFNRACLAIYRSIHTSEVRQLPQAFVDAWGIGQLLHESARAAPAWPDDQRIDTIGANGNDGQHYVEREPGPAVFGGRRTDRSRA